MVYELWLHTLSMDIEFNYNHETMKLIHLVERGNDDTCTENQFDTLIETKNY